jgi:hypothetical protein
MNYILFALLDELPLLYLFRNFRFKHCLFNFCRGFGLLSIVFIAMARTYVFVLKIGGKLWVLFLVSSFDLLL